MLNRNGNENGIKINTSNWQTNKNCACSTIFFLISKKPNLHVQHAFLSFFAVVLQDYNAVLYD